VARIWLLYPNDKLQLTNVIYSETTIAYEKKAV